MVIRFLLIVVLVMFFGRALWRLVEGIAEGASSGSRSLPNRGVRMVRDPVCGTYVVPSRALSSGQGETTTYFCSEECRAKFRKT